MSDETIHYSADGLGPSPCGVNTPVTPYTYASPEWAEVTCPACLESKPEKARYSYRIKYMIVDEFGDLRWDGTVTLHQDKPRPTGEAEVAVFDALKTAKTIRRSCDAMGAPAGRVLITAVADA